VRRVPQREVEAVLMGGEPLCERSGGRLMTGRSPCEGLTGPELGADRMVVPADAKRSVVLALDHLLLRPLSPVEEGLGEAQGDEERGEGRRESAAGQCAQGVSHAVLYPIRSGEVAERVCMPLAPTAP
jgi:hypothetical protein